MACHDKKRRNPPKDIYMVDPDGRDLVRLTNDNTLSLTPSWASDGKHITYAQFEFRLFGKVRKKGIVLKMHDLQSGDRSLLAAMEGMTGKADWAPNGSKIAVTLSFSGRPELYFLDPLNPGGPPEPLSRRIQWRRAGTDGLQANLLDLLFDVEPSWAPDSKKIVFSSRRTGHPNIYVLDLASMTASQLTFAGTYNSSPAWSPKGDKILFATQKSGEGNFDLYIIDPDGNNLSRITAGERLGRHIHSENPSWAPTGRHFAYASNEGGSFGIWVSTLDGSFKKRISPQDKECYTPSWGPYEGQ
jgi:TolB protein